jgi:hypothetical protein
LDSHIRWTNLKGSGQEGGVMLWLDEMGVRSDAAAGRSWGRLVRRR